MRTKGAFAALYTLLLCIVAAAVFNIVVLVTVVKTGLVRIEVGPPPAPPPTVEDVTDVHARMLEMERSLAQKEIKAEEALASAEAAKKQIDIDKQTLSADKETIQKTIDGKIAALKKEREDLKLVRSEFEEKRLKQLAKVYEGMKPKEAVKVFENMDMRTVVEILSRMKTRNSAKIVEKMRPEMASFLSEMLKSGATKKAAQAAPVDPRSSAKK
jgi:flagellar motility protein MotE (MotC chaperone)